jgi:luciferase family oxidoreductase group 1
MLHALYPGRVDLGIGRAPGGGPIEALALRRERKSPMPDDFTEQLSELLAFLDEDFPRGHPFGKIRVSPAMPGAPDVWLLGSSMWSANTAAQFGLPYAFAHFFSPEPTRAAIETYQRSFVPSNHRAAPEAMVAVGVLCAETQQEAEYLHASVRLLQWRIRQGSREPIASPEDALRELERTSDAGFRQAASEPPEWPRYFIGTPETVRRELNGMASALGIEELVIVTITHSHVARLRSYELLAQALDLHSPELSQTRDPAVAR